MMQEEEEGMTAGHYVLHEKREKKKYETLRRDGAVISTDEHEILRWRE